MTIQIYQHPSISTYLAVDTAKLIHGEYNCRPVDAIRNLAKNTAKPITPSYLSLISEHTLLYTLPTGIKIYEADGLYKAVDWDNLTCSPWVSNAHNALNLIKNQDIHSHPYNFDPSGKLYTPYMGTDVTHNYPANNPPPLPTGVHVYKTPEGNYLAVDYTEGTHTDLFNNLSNLLIYSSFKQGNELLSNPKLPTSAHRIFTEVADLKAELYQ